MKICFVLNEISTEKCGTSVALMKNAHERGHEVFVMSVGDFLFRSDMPITVYCIKLPSGLKEKEDEDFLKAIQNKELKKEPVNTTDLDVLIMRNNPTEDPTVRNWVEHADEAYGR